MSSDEEKKETKNFHSVSEFTMDESNETMNPEIAFPPRSPLTQGKTNSLPLTQSPLTRDTINSRQLVSMLPFYTGTTDVPVLHVTNWLSRSKATERYSYGLCETTKTTKTPHQDWGLSSDIHSWRRFFSRTNYALKCGNKIHGNKIEREDKESRRRKWN